MGSITMNETAQVTPSVMPLAELLPLLQLFSPSLPIGAYSYSEGLEWLVEQGQITTATDLAAWLSEELAHGSIRVELAIASRGYQAVVADDRDRFTDWNAWFLAARETAELRRQTLQMGRSLGQLLKALDRRAESWLIKDLCLPLASGLAADLTGVSESALRLGYGFSWLNNLMTAAIRLGVLGQTQGQQLLVALQPSLLETTETIATWADADLACCSLGLSLASMGHATQYSRLFRS